MPFNIIRFLEDHNIEYPTDGPRYRPGWVQINCPFCSGSSRGFDLGFNLEQGYFNCWQCRGKNIYKVIMKLTGSDFPEAKRIYHMYSGRPSLREEPRETRVRRFTKLPPECGSMSDRHRQYLIDRHYDPDRLESTFNLKGTNHLGDYKFRIIAPIYYEGKLVSYQGRDITGKSPLRYKACEKINETIHHKHILYHMDETNDAVAIVEGLFDVFRMGLDSVALFGTGYTSEQATLLAKRYKRVFLMFDPEPTAQKIANELAWNLNYKGKEVHIVDELDEGVDPGDMKQDDANALMRQLNLRGWNK